MRRGLLLLALVLLCVAGASVLVLSDPEAPPPEVETGSAETEPEPGRAAGTHSRIRPLEVRAERDRTVTRRAPDEVEHDPGPDEPEALPPVAVQVVVGYSDGSRAPEASVQALQLNGSRVAGAIGGAVTTDVEGRARLEVPRGAAFLLTARLGEYVGLAPRLSAGHLPADPVEITLDRRLQIRGRLLSRDGGAIAGGEVTFLPETDDTFPPHWSTVSAEDGGFVLPALPRSWLASEEEARTHELQARARAHAPGRLQLSVEELERGPVEFVLEPGALVRGRVLLPNGAPAAGVAVSSPNWVTDLTDAEGLYELDGLPPDGESLRLVPTDHAPTLGPAVPTVAGEYDLPDVHLRDGRALQVLVVDVAGTALEGVDVQVVDTELGFVVRQGRTDAEGRLDLPALADRPHVLRLSEPSQESWAAGREMEIPDVYPLADVQRFVLQGVRTVHLVFLDASDRSEVRVSSVDLQAVRADGGGAGWGWEGGDISSVRFQVDQAGTYDVTVELPGYDAETARDVVVPENGEVRIQVLLRRAR